MERTGYPPAPAMAGCVVVARMAFGELRSHRNELPEHLALIVDDAYRVLEPVALPLSAYQTAAHLLMRSSDHRHGFGSI
jgi:hypothetical protein